MRHHFIVGLGVAVCLFWIGIGCSTTPTTPPPVIQVHATPSPIYQAIVRREFGTESDAMAAVAREVASLKPDQYAPIEQHLLWVLQNPKITLPGKTFACEMLRIVGSPACVPTVSRLLLDEKMSHPARKVLLNINGPDADNAMLWAATQTTGVTRIGIINTLGDRRNSKSVAVLAGLLGNCDDATAVAILNALGKIGDSRAAAVLEQTKIAASLTRDWANACVRCADSLAADGRLVRADEIYRAILLGSYPSSARSGALIGVARIEKEHSVPLILKELWSTDFAMRGAAGTAIVTTPGSATTLQLLQSLPGKDSNQTVLLLQSLASRGDATAPTDRIVALMSHQDATIREAAVKALGRLGNSTSVPPLAALLATQGEMATAAKQALLKLEGPGVVEALVQQARTASPAVRQAVMAVLFERRLPQALQVARAAAGDTDPGVRSAAWKALGTMGGKDDFALLLSRMLASQDAAQQDALADALANIGRHNVKEPLIDMVVKALPQANTERKSRLLPVFSILGGSKSLQAVRASLGDDETVRNAAVRILAKWSDAQPMPDLLTIARQDKNEGNKILALQGYIRMNAKTTDANKKLQAYRDALSLATRPTEKQQVLAGVLEINSVDSLKLIEPCLDDPQVQHEAYLAYGKIAEALIPQSPAVAKESLLRVADKSPDKEQRQKARASASKIK